MLCNFNAPLRRAHACAGMHIDARLRPTCMVPTPVLRMRALLLKYNALSGVVSHEKVAPEVAGCCARCPCSGLGLVLGRSTGDCSVPAEQVPSNWLAPPPPAKVGSAGGGHGLEGRGRLTTGAEPG